MKTFRYASALIVLALLCPCALAFLRESFGDDVVVARSELIVVGHLKKDSIVLVLHPRKPSEGASWEHHATLVITEVLKGKAESTEIPVIIHYGLNPFVGGNFKIEGIMEGHMPLNPRLPKDVVQIYDTGNSALMMEPLVDDACQDNIWLLRGLASTDAKTEVKPDFGIRDPEDLRPLALKDYLVAYLAPDPEAAVRKQVDTSRIIVERGGRYLEKLRVDRLAATAAPKDDK